MEAQYVPGSGPIPGVFTHTNSFFFFLPSNPHTYGLVVVSYGIRGQIREWRGGHLCDV